MYICVYVQVCVHIVHLYITKLHLLFHLKPSFSHHMVEEQERYLLKDLLEVNALANTQQCSFL